MSKIERKKNIGATALLRPRITEKASSQTMNERPSYVFEIAEGFNKNEIKKAVKEAYGVIPTRVNIIKNPAKQVFVRGKWGMKKGVTKAVVTLKKDDKIDIA